MNFCYTCNLTHHVFSRTRRKSLGQPFANEQYIFCPYTHRRTMRGVRRVVNKGRVHRSEFSQLGHNYSPNSTLWYGYTDCGASQRRSVRGCFPSEHCLDVHEGLPSRPRTIVGSIRTPRRRCCVEVIQGLDSLSCIVGRPVDCGENPSLGN